MSGLIRGVIAGVFFGVIAALTMLPMEFPDKTAPILNRFGVGFVISCVRLPWPGWVVGLIFGILLSVPDAIITKANAPILVPGAAGSSSVDSFTVDDAARGNGLIPRSPD